MKYLREVRFNYQTEVFFYIYLSCTKLYLSNNNLQNLILMCKI